MTDPPHHNIEVDAELDRLASSILELEQSAQVTSEALESAGLSPDDPAVHLALARRLVELRDREAAENAALTKSEADTSWPTKGA